ncbi:hypothetical protein [Heyndrickxia coagulans]|jgi:hypothetical protein|nr:hypothetical protein [Heyndrickxia coagulans]
MGIVVKTILKIGMKGISYEKHVTRTGKDTKKYLSKRKKKKKK